MVSKGIGIDTVLLDATGKSRDCIDVERGGRTTGRDGDSSRSLGRADAIILCFQVVLAVEC